MEKYADGGGKTDGPVNKKRGDDNKSVCYVVYRIREKHATAIYFRMRVVGGHLMVVMLLVRQCVVDYFKNNRAGDNRARHNRD